MSFTDISNIYNNLIWLILISKKSIVLVYDDKMNLKNKTLAYLRLLRFHSGALIASLSLIGAVVMGQRDFTCNFYHWTSISYIWICLKRLYGS